MDIRPIRTEADYDWALAELEIYFEHEPARGSAEADRFDILSALVGAYEDEHWAIEAPDSVSAIRHWMDLHDLSQADLALVLGSRSRASEILHGKRPLNMAMALALKEKWKMPADLLIRPATALLAA